MCGIVGIHHANRRPVSRELLTRMNSCLRHRGPDGDGLHLEPGLGLAHRRLSIIDVSGGSQPLSNETGDIWITFNGEIYNFQKLRRILEDRGHQFQTVSDTETIVHAYEEYGEDCLSHLCGMFAFAIWDAPRQKLFVARDRVGIKPLYYYFDGARFLFASEMKALLADRSVPRQLNLAALRDYLTYGYIPVNRTIFQQVHKLMPGHYAAVEQRADQAELQLNVKSYWDLQFRPDPKPSEMDWIDGLRDVLSETVEAHMMSDVPLGAFLSGGLDSGCMVALMARSASRPVKTFSIGFEETAFNELPFARQVAQHYGTEHHEFVVRPDAIELLPLLARQYDEPFGDSSAIPTYYVSKLARTHVTVALSGDGGDEAFAGYTRYAQSLDALSRQGKLGFLPEKLLRSMSFAAANTLPKGTRGIGTLRRLGMSPCETYLDVTYHHSADFLTELLHSDALCGLQQEDDAFRRYFEGVNAADDLTRMQYLDTKTYLPEDILAKVDRASMMCSLEARVPLLDHRVLEFAARIPTKFKFRNGKGKYIFRRLLEELLPKGLLDRPKAGFGVPLVHWFNQDLAGYTRDVLFEARSLDRGLFRREAIEQILAEHGKGLADRSPDIWRLLFFEHWCRHYLDEGTMATGPVSAAPVEATSVRPR